MYNINHNDRRIACVITFVIWELNWCMMSLRCQCVPYRLICSLFPRPFFNGVLSYACKSNWFLSIWFVAHIVHFTNDHALNWPLNTVYISRKTIYFKKKNQKGAWHSWNGLFYMSEKCQICVQLNRLQYMLSTLLAYGKVKCTCYIVRQGDRISNRNTVWDGKKMFSTKVK